MFSHGLDVRSRGGVQETDAGLIGLRDAMHLESPNQAHGALRAVLHTLRDRQRADETAHLAAQLPEELKALWERRAA